MDKKPIVALLVIVLLAISGWIYYRQSYMVPQSVEQPNPVDSRDELLASVPKVFVPIANKTISLTGSTTQFGSVDEPNESFGTVTLGELVAEHNEMIFTTIAANYGGSGEFFYLVAFVPTASGYQSAGYTSIGDRVDIEKLTVNDDGVITLDYLDHSADQAMADAPNVKVERMYRYENNEFVQVQ